MESCHHTVPPLHFKIKPCSVSNMFIFGPLSLSFLLLPDHEELPKQTAHACFRHAWQAAQALWGPLGTTPLPLVSVLPGFSSPLGENTLCFITFAIWYSSVCSAAITRAHSCKRQVCELSRGSHSAEKWWCVCVSVCVLCFKYVRVIAINVSVGHVN